MSRAWVQAIEEPIYVIALGHYDMLPNHMGTADDTKFALDSFLKEKALVEKPGLGKPS